MRPDHPLKRTHHSTVILGMIFSLLIGVTALVYAVFVVVPNVIVSDESSPSIDEVALQPLSLKPNENGYPALRDAIVTTNMPSLDASRIDAIIDQRAWTDASTVALLDQYADVLAAFRQAADASALVNPIYATQASAEAAIRDWMRQDTTNIDWSIPYDEYLMTSLRTYNKLFRIRAHHLAANNKTREALLELATIATVDAKWANGRNNIITHMAIVAALRDTLTEINLIAAERTLTPEDALIVTAALPIPDMRLGWISAYQIERVAGLVTLPESIYDFTQSAVVGAKPGVVEYLSLGITDGPKYSIPVNVMALLTGQTKMLYLPNQTKRLAIGHVNDTLWRLAKGCEDRTLEAEAWTEANDDGWRWKPLTTPNYIGRNLFRTWGFYGEVREANMRRCNLAALAGMTKISIALLAYEDTNNSLPPTLSELTPTYLASVPTDPYSGKAFSYDRTKRILGSLGIDQRENPDASSQNILTYPNPFVKVLTKDDLIVTPISRATNIYYVAVGDNGKNGTKIGCDDSLIPVERQLSLVNRSEDQKIRIALEALLTDRTATVVGTDYLNALANSQLTVDRVVFDNATTKYVIALSGTIRSGGTCDDPRIIAQLTQTAEQFVPQNGVTITVNGKPLASVLSGRGE